MPAVPFTASANPAYAAVFSVTDDLRQLGQHGRLHLSRHWLSAAVLLAAVGLLWLGWRTWGSALLTRWRHWQAERAARYVASADYAWQQVPADLARRPPRFTALYLWVRRSQGGLRLVTPGDAATQQLLRQCYGPDGNPGAVLAPLKARFAHLHAQVSPRSPTAPPRPGLRPLNPTQNRESR